MGSSWLGADPGRQPSNMTSPGEVTNAAPSNAADGEDSGTLGSIVTEAVAEERRLRQEEIQKGVTQLLDGRVEEAVLTTSETEVLTYFRLDCHRSCRMFQVHSWSVSLSH